MAPPDDTRGVETPENMTALSEDEVAQLRRDIAAEWELEGHRALRRSLTFKSFSAAFGLATRVALLAEAEGHHPELTVGWGHLEIEFTTHATGGLTRSDFIMAAKVDRLLPR